MENPSSLLESEAKLLPVGRASQKRRRKVKPASELTPWQLRTRASWQLNDAVAAGILPRLSDVVVKCTDCDERATCYDHRNYYHALAVDPVCQGCNNRRGPGFPINPDGNPYYKATFDGSGYCWGNLEGGVAENRATHDFKAGAEKSVAEFIDEHWITWELDADALKATQETFFLRKQPLRSFAFQKSFLRGLHDWYGVEPI